MKLSQDENLLRLIKSLGLSEYEAKAYLSLTTHGPLTAIGVSDTTGLPRSRIYSTLDQLRKRGWIEADESRPKTYIAKPPSHTIETTRLLLEKQLKATTQEIIDKLQPLYQYVGNQERTNIWIVRGNENVLSRLRKMLGSTSEEVMIAIPHSIHPLVSDSLRELRANHVQISIMSTRETAESDLRTLMHLGQIRVRDQMFGGGAISDRQRIMLLLGGPGGPLSLAIFSDHPGVVILAREYFNYLWKDSFLFEV